MQGAVFYLKKITHPLICFLHTLKIRLIIMTTSIERLLFKNILKVQPGCYFDCCYLTTTTKKNVRLLRPWQATTWIWCFVCFCVEVPFNILTCIQQDLVTWCVICLGSCLSSVHKCYPLRSAPSKAFQSQAGQTSL